MSFFTPVASTSAKFPIPGATVTGEITEISEPMQARKYEDNSLDYWPSGDPVMQVKITLQTTEHDPQIQDDDGKRGLWVRQSSQMLYAIQAALKAAGQNDLQVGGRLQMTYTGDDPNSKNPRNPRKLYAAAYQAPASGGGMFTEQQTPQAPAQMQQAQGYAPAAPAQPAPQQYIQPNQPMQQQAPAQMQQAPQAPAQGYAPAAPAQPAPLTPEQENSIKSLIGQGIDTNTIVNALANPTITHQVVDTYRTAA